MQQQVTNRQYLALLARTLTSRCRSIHGAEGWSFSVGDEGISDGIGRLRMTSPWLGLCSIDRPLPNHDVLLVPIHCFPHDTMPRVSHVTAGEMLLDEFIYRLVKDYFDHGKREDARVFAEQYGAEVQRAEDRGDAGGPWWLPLKEA